jgi:hypothetical protein
MSISLRCRVIQVLKSLEMVVRIVNGWCAACFSVMVCCIKFSSASALIFITIPDVVDVVVSCEIAMPCL